MVSISLPLRGMRTCSWRTLLPLLCVATVGVFSQSSAKKHIVLSHEKGVGSFSTTVDDPHGVRDGILRPQFLSKYGKLPLTFEVNRGQTDPKVKFLARTAGYSLFLTSNEALLTFNSISHAKTGGAGPNKNSHGKAPPRAIAGMRLLGTSPGAEVQGVDELPGKSNYLIGNDPAKWRVDIPHFAKVKYHNIYPGIDLVYYGNGRELEYDFVVFPGADLGRIRLRMEGTNGIQLHRNGDLALRTTAGDKIRWRKPQVYQERDGIRKPVSAAFVARNNHEFGFEVGSYDRNQPLIIDPSLAYSTYLGGSDLELGFGIAVDAEGSAYVTGETHSYDFPSTQESYQPYIALNCRYGYCTPDVFVTKLNAEGTEVIYSTYLGGHEYDSGKAIALDRHGRVYVAGETTSADFPTTPDAFQPSCGSCMIPEAFVAVLNETGSSLLYSTYLGSRVGLPWSGESSANAIAVNKDGSFAVTGSTWTEDFPTTAEAYQPDFEGDRDHANAFVAEFDSLHRTVFSTYFGGSHAGGTGIALDDEGYTYVSGWTGATDFPLSSEFGTGTGGAFISKFNPEASDLVYSALIHEGLAGGIAVDSGGNAYIAGITNSETFPTTPGAFQTEFHGAWDAFVAKLNAAGTELIYSTFLGGSEVDGGGNIAIDAGGNAWISASTASSDFPVTQDAFQRAYAGGYDVYISELNSTGSKLVYSTYLGGTNSDAGRAIALDCSGNIYVIGDTDSRNFPITDVAFQTSLHGLNDAFVAKISINTKQQKQESTTTSQPYRKEN